MQRYENNRKCDEKMEAILTRPIHIRNKLEEAEEDKEEVKKSQVDVEILLERQN